MKTEQTSALQPLFDKHPMGATIKSIHDFDESRSIIAYQVDHPSLGDKGQIFDTHAEAKHFICDLYNSGLDNGEIK